MPTRPRARLPADALFICIGGAPRTGGAAGIGLATNTAGYLVTGGDAARESGSDWPLPRQPLPLETNLPGVFAAGDVRCGSVKRCAGADTSCFRFERASSQRQHEPHKDLAVTAGGTRPVRRFRYVHR